MGSKVRGIEAVNVTFAAISDAKMHNGESVNDRCRVKYDELWNATRMVLESWLQVLDVESQWHRKRGLRMPIKTFEQIW